MATNRKTAFLPVGVEQYMRDKAIEAAGLALIAVAITLFAALVTYSPSDPSLNTASGRGVSNLMGHAGAYVSDIALQSLGLAGGLLVPVAAGWGWRLWKDHTLSRTWMRVGLLPLGILTTAMALSGFHAPEAWPLTAGLGGYAGTWLTGQIVTLFYDLSLPMDIRFLVVAAAVIAPPILFFVIGFSSAEWRNGAQRTAGLVGGMRHMGQRIHGLRETLRSVLQRAQRPARPRTGNGERREPMLLDSPDGERVIEPRTVKPDLVEPKPSRPAPGKRANAQRQRTLDLASPEGEMQLPPLDLLDDPADSGSKNLKIDEESLQQNARLLEGVLEDFGVRGEIEKVRPGPVVTLYELEPAPGTKTSRVIGLADDIARSMSAISVRIATVPGRSVIGIELPNARRETVYLRELLASKAFEESRAKLPLVAGKDIGGAPVIVDLARMPHLLIAGTTGSGKSVGLNAMILSLLYRLSPEECKFIMIDPKMLELSIYDGIPHLIAPVVTEPKRAVVALKWTVQEMETRYRAMSKLGVRNVEGYNKRVEEARRKGEILTRKVQTGFDAETGKPVIEEQPLDLSSLPMIVVVVDEMADLMLVAGKDIEATIQRLAQMARAAGIHLIMATQRPSVDVITGTIKANFPTRISFQVTSKIDSRTILGEQGAEQLLGQGDMLYMAGGGRISRVHGPFVHDAEVESVVRFLKSQGAPTYIEAITDAESDEFGEEYGEAPGATGDDLYDQAVAFVAREGKASTSFIQRQFRIGYNRAANIIDTMEKEGVVSAANHV
ncbi:MAG: DNA translocase FtsK 4TM domain-containing protein, partial [Proteobacteria bacterium]|nr:DNA translocase FtsK 4TM domain-containing protein [Pseudomonadota bacterium]